MKFSGQVCVLPVRWHQLSNVGRLVTLGVNDHAGQAVGFRLEHFLLSVQGSAGGKLLMHAVKTLSALLFCHKGHHQNVIKNDSFLFH
ncbi:hypothetical protein [Acetobacter sp. LMG 32666]|uniref:hypothetical protein n=1 Tax=Acetobacter sp. LMG 32666 TaxID=2959295 RepID=UPI0030C7C4EC